MKRRSFLQAGLAVAGATLLTGHSSDRQWYALGPQHWLIAAAHGDAEACRLAGAVSALLAARVPGSQAMSTEAESEREVVQLLRTHQLELAIVGIDAANGALSGSVTSFPDGPVPLRTVAPFGAHLLVALEGYSTDKAARIAGALAGFRWQDGSVPTRGSGPQSKVPLHPGAIRFKQARESKTGE
ncbi:MAG TPA: hypothetical protein VMH26_21105 [Burkholderiales bacterium]|nr:hypothetical protein [Burkholderiales bacterium]